MTKTLILLIISIGLSSTSEASSCANVKVLSGTDCSNLEMEFDLSQCGETGKKLIGKSKCKGHLATSTVSTESGKYSATFKSEEGGWGEKTWNLQGEVEQVKAEKKAEAPKEVKKITPVAKVKKAIPVKVAEIPKIVPVAKVVKEEKPTEEKAEEKKEETNREVAEASSEPTPEPGEGTLLKNMGGVRGAMDKVGLSIGLNYSGEYSSILSGGVDKKSTTLGKAFLGINQDFEKLIGWQGGSFHTNLMWTHGTGLADYTGDAQGVSNINSGAPGTFKIYDAWLQQNFSDNAFSLLVGLYDVNSEFYVTDSSLPFLNGSFGIGLEATQGNGVGNTPSVYPTPSFGGRLKIEANDHFYMMMGVFDAVPGNGDSQASGTSIKLRSEDGLFSIVEAGYVRGKNEKLKELPAKYAVGHWSYSEPYDSLITSGDKRGSYGFYLLGDQAFSDHFSIFTRLGIASKDVNEVRYNLSGGVVFHKLVPFFDNDQLGFGFTQVGYSDDKKYVAENVDGTPIENSETTLEVLYRFEPYAGIALQPDAQYILNPSASATADDVFVFLLRLDLAL